MAYPSPSSLSPTSTFDVGDDEHQQLVQSTPCHRTSSTTLNSLSTSKRSRTASPHHIETRPRASLQAWLNAVSTSPLPSVASEQFQLDQIESPTSLQHFSQSSTSSTVARDTGLIPADIAKPAETSFSSHPTPAATPQQTTQINAQNETTANNAKTGSSHASSGLTSKDRFVEGLVGASVLAIESIWGQVGQDQCTLPSESKVLPLHWFVKEVLRRSRTSCSTLQLALYYLHKSRREIRDIVARADVTRSELSRLDSKVQAQREALARGAAHPSPPLLPTAHEDEVMELAGTSDVQRLAALLEIQHSPVLCGRRMFLAALIGASKFLQDRNYSNRAWARISGLPVIEINTNERAFLNMMKWDLHLAAPDFQRWTERLATLTCQGAVSESTIEATRVGLSLSRSQSDYTPIEQPTEELMRVVGVPGPSRHHLGRSHSDTEAESLSAKSIRLSSAASRVAKASTFVSQVASPPETEVDSASSSSSSGEEDHVLTGSIATAAALSTRKVRNLPLRRGIALSRQRNAATSLLGVPRNAPASQPRTAGMDSE